MSGLLSIVFATRNRPESLRRFHESLRNTCQDIPEVIVYIDDDDKQSLDVANELGIKSIVGPRQLISICYNQAAALATNDLIMYAGDDIVFQTQDWDVLVQKSFSTCSDKIMVAHGDDLSHGGNRAATHGILHRNWINTLGYFVPPYFNGWFDNWITFIGDALRRRVFIPFINEHMHYTHGKSDFDKTYEEAKHRQDADVQKFKDLINARLDAVDKLKSVMHGEVYWNREDFLRTQILPTQNVYGHCISCNAVCVVLTQGHFRCGQCGHQW